MLLVNCTFFQTLTLKQNSLKTAGIKCTLRSVCHAALIKDAFSSQAVNQVASNKWIAIIGRRQSSVGCLFVFSDDD